MMWTPENIEKLERLWREGLSASQVAAELGGGVTRNAVIGKIHRLGLTERTVPKKKPRKVAKPVEPARNADAFHARQKAAKEGPGRILPVKPIAEAMAPMVEPAQEIGAPISKRVALVDLTISACRWPLGDPRDDGFAFCGAKGADMAAVPPRPYCVFHARIAYPSHSEGAPQKQRGRYFTLKSLARPR
jgi:GcrA cell cycle regulator